MTIFEFFKELNDTAKERLKTPITGAFLFSFLVYNWRPIFLLLFSEASIEDKIVVINHEYCNLWSVIFPLVFAFVYTIGVPMLTVLIDGLLFSTKKKRITAIYDSKKHVIAEKIIFAGEEKLLKDAESGNKEKQDFLDQIERLENDKIQMKQSHDLIQVSDKNIISNLNFKLKQINEEAIERLHTAVESDTDESDLEEYDPIKFKNKAIDIFKKLTIEDKKDFMNLRDVDGRINLDRVTPTRKRKFLINKLFQKDKLDNWLISDMGISVYNLIAEEQ